MCAAKERDRKVQVGQAEYEKKKTENVATAAASAGVTKVEEGGGKEEEERRQEVLEMKETESVSQVIQTSRRRKSQDIKVPVLLSRGLQRQIKQSRQQQVWVGKRNHDLHPSRQVLSKLVSCLLQEPLLRERDCSCPSSRPSEQTGTSTGKCA